MPPKLAASLERDSVFDPLGITEQYEGNRESAAAEGYLIPDDEAFRFSDNDTSGADESREGLARLIALVVSGDPGFDRVYVKDATRFGRWDDPREHIYIEKLLERHGVKLRYCDEGTSDPELEKGISQKNFGHYVRRLFNTLFASEERRKLIERITRGMRDKVREGFYPGATAPYGTVRWLVSESDHEFLEPVPQGKRIGRLGCRYDLRWAEDGTKQTVEQIFRYLADGASLRGVARRLNKRGIATPSGDGRWYGSSIARIARNPLYCGDLVWGRTTRDPLLDPVPHRKAKRQGKAAILYRDFMPDPPVSRRLFQDVQTALERGARFGRPALKPYPLSPVLYCSECGEPWHGHTSTKQNQRRYYRHGPHGPKSCPHRNRYFRASKIEAAVFGDLFTALDEGALDEAIKGELQRLMGEAGAEQVERDKADARRALEHCRRRLTNLTEELSKAETEAQRGAIRSQSAGLGHQIDELETRLSALQSEQGALSDAHSRVGQVAALLTEKAELIRSAEPKRARRLVVELVDRIEFNPETREAVLSTRLL